ncbi:asparaginase (plasmid) [Aureimonas ureilytica]|uniref:asparaginase n=1 Tax=Aureimonas ureilytica TaxID=401562 RepID=UPI003CFB688C
MTGGRARPRVALVATGGTIASRREADGASRPSLGGDSLLDALGDTGLAIEPVDLMAKDSSSLTAADMQAVSTKVGALLADPDLAGVVVLHGTDAMEETALLVQLQNQPARPVVFTGAQFTADHPEADGPGNLAAALRLAGGLVGREDAAGRGVLLAFGGRVLPAWSLYKRSADAPDAFRQSLPQDNPREAALPGDVGALRVDIVAIHPGCDGALVEASLAAGADGIVLAALGSGNATPAVVEAVGRAQARGVPVVVSSRVPEGRLVASYGGGGGGHDLAGAGAIHSAELRPGQARILLLAHLAAGTPRDALRAAFAARVKSA